MRTSETLIGTGAKSARDAQVSGTCSSRRCSLRTALPPSSLCDDVLVSALPELTRTQRLQSATPVVTARAGPSTGTDTPSRRAALATQQRASSSCPPRRRPASSSRRKSCAISGGAQPVPHSVIVARAQRERAHALQREKAQQSRASSRDSGAWRRAASIARAQSRRAPGRVARAFLGALAARFLTRFAIPYSFLLLAGWTRTRPARRRTRPGRARRRGVRFPRGRCRSLRLGRAHPTILVLLLLYSI